MGVEKGKYAEFVWVISEQQTQIWQPMDLRDILRTKVKGDNC